MDNKSKKICKECEKEFYANIKEIKRGNAKFCSISCASTFNGRLRKLEKIPNVVCSYCGEHFYKNSSQKLNSKHNIFFCCREHKDKGQRLGGIKEIHPPHYGNGYNSKFSYRKRALENKECKCERCGYSENPYAIVIHHKDYNRDNNELNNLEVLCANCHTIEHCGPIQE